MSMIHRNPTFAGREDLSLYGPRIVLYYGAQNGRAISCMESEIKAFESAMLEERPFFTFYRESKSDTAVAFNNYNSNRPEKIVVNLKHVQLYEVYGV